MQRPLTDATREAIEIDHARLRAILQHATTGIVALDAHGVIETFSQKAEQIFGWHAAELVGKPIDRLFDGHASGRANGSEIWRRLKAADGLIELDLPRRDGSVFPAEAGVITISLDAGCGTFDTLIARDLSARRAMEQQLREVEAALRHQAEREAELANARLRELLASSQQGIVMTDADDRIVLVNAAFLDTYFTGEARRPWRERGWIGRPFKEICRAIIECGRVAQLPGVDVETMVNGWCTLRNRGDGTGIVQALSEGRHVIAATSRMQDGGLLTIATDITEHVRKANELALITDNLPVLIVYLDVEQRFRFANQTAEQWHRRPASEIIGRHLKDIVSPDYYALLKPLVDGVLAGTPQRAELRTTYADGKTRFVQVQYVPDFGSGSSVVGFFVLITDVSEIVRKTDQLELIMDSVPALIAYADRAEYLRFINRTGEQWHRQPRSTLLDKPLSEVVPPDYYQSAKPMIDAVHAGQPQRAQLRRTGDDGVVRWVDTSWVPDFDPDGRVVGHFVIGSDITESVRKTNDLAVITDNLPGFIGYVDSAERYRRINRSGEEWLGRPAAEIIGKTLKEILLPEHYEQVRPHVQAVLAGRPQYWEYEAAYPDGRSRWLEARYIPDIDAGGNVVGCFGLVLDVTQRRAAEERLAQSQKMEAVGQLTAGVAHDFNNLLGVVLGNLDLASLQLRDRPREAEMLARAIEAAEKGARLTQRLLSFSRRQTLLTRDCDVNALLRDLSDLLTRTIGASVAIELRLGANLPEISIDPAQLESAILNLAINAKDAMPNGGNLTIETTRVEIDAAEAALRAEAQPGAYAMITVSDTGVGMSPEVINRAFEPFFTTKGIGQGTGLGLSMVYGFVKQSGGHIALESAAGRGTTIRLYLPSKAASAESEIDLAARQFARAEAPAS